MRIRKGNEVEVWIQEAASPVGAWRVGVVQWSNGHSYILRWNDGGPNSGRISRKSVRPCPPPAPVPPDLRIGAMVEVRDEDDCLWKCAVVEGARVDGGRRFRVKILGTPKILTVAPDRLRLRQMLREDDVWVKLLKDNQFADAGPMPLRANGSVYGSNYNYMPAAPGLNPLKQKRGPDTDAVANDQRLEGPCNKKLCVKAELRHDNVEVIEVLPKVSVDKQDEIGSRSEDHEVDVVGTGSNSDHSDNQQKQEQLQRQDNDDDGDSESVSFSDDSDNSDDSSADSDSRTKSDNDSGDHAVVAAELAPTSAPRGEDRGQKAHPPPQFRAKDHHRCDGTAASFGSWVRPLLNDKKAVVQEPVHLLELEAYTSLTRAFQASGDALSWEKAELLADLRKHLHISDDEHLQVINAVLNRKGTRFGGRQGNL